MNKKFILFLPLILLLSICLLLFVGLHKDPKQIASALIDEPVPEFYQANLLEPNQIVSPRDFPKKPFLLNVLGKLVWLLPTGTPSFDGNFKRRAHCGHRLS